MTSENFVPKMIGKQDIEKYTEIKQLYSKLVSCATAFLYETQTLLADESLESNFILQLLNKDKASLLHFLKLEYVKANKIEYPGLSVEKLISLGLIDLPESYGIIVESWDAMNQLITKIETTKFCFSLSRLISEDGFDLNDEFEQELVNLTARFTENEKQNEILEIVEKFCSVVNDLIELRLVKPQGRLWMSISDIMDAAVANENKSSRPLHPDMKMFSQSPFSQFGFKKPFMPYTPDRNAIIN